MDRDVMLGSPAPLPAKTNMPFYALFGSGFEHGNCRMDRTHGVDNRQPWLAIVFAAQEFTG